MCSTLIQIVLFHRSTHSPILPIFCLSSKALVAVKDVIYFINGIFAAGCSIESLCPDEVFFMTMIIYDLVFVSVTRRQLYFACTYFFSLEFFDHSQNRQNGLKHMQRF